jgi:hypothetical protein
MHAAEFKQVTYHIQRRPDAANPVQSAGVYPHITYYLDDPPGITSGYLAFQSAIQAWSVHDRSTEALLWSHEDAFTDHNFLAGWLKQASSCVVVSDVTDYLPSDVTEWASATDWPWAKETRTQIAGKHFLDLAADRGRTLKCVGRDFAKSGFACAQSDVVAIRTTCNGTEPRLLFDWLQAASDAELWLEISWPNCIRCAFEDQSIFGYRLFTRWDEQRNNASATWAQYAKRTHDAPWARCRSADVNDRFNSMGPCQMQGNARTFDWTAHKTWQHDLRNVIDVDLKIRGRADLTVG